MYVVLMDLVWPSGFCINKNLKTEYTIITSFYFCSECVPVAPGLTWSIQQTAQLSGVYLIFDILYRWHEFTSLLLACILRAVQVRPLGACTPSVCLLFGNLNMLFAIRVCYHTFLHLSDACNICQDFISI